jgi:hypothetical protein
MALVLRREWWGRAGFGDFGASALLPGPAATTAQAKIQNSGFWDESYYRSKNPDVVASGWAPLNHFIQHGGVWPETRDPGPRFSTSYYFEHNHDVRDARVNALLHYIQNGRAEGRGIAPAAGSAPPPARPVYDPTSAPATTPGAVATGPNRQQLADRFNAARQRALAATDAYNKAVAQANRAIGAAKRKGAPDAIAHANQAAALVPAVHDKAQASIEAANAYGRQQGFSGLRGFEGYAWAYGDLVDDAGASADQAAAILGQIQSHADQAELADSSYSPPAAGPAPTTQVPAQIATEQVSPASPAPTPMSISSPGSSVSVSVAPDGSATVSGEPPVGKVLLYGGLAALALLLLKGGRGNG